MCSIFPHNKARIYMKIYKIDRSTNNHQLLTTDNLWTLFINSTPKILSQQLFTTYM